MESPWDAWCHVSHCPTNWWAFLFCYWYPKMGRGVQQQRKMSFSTKCCGIKDVRSVPVFALLQIPSRERHWCIASSNTLWARLAHMSISTQCSWDHKLISVSEILDLYPLPTVYNSYPFQHIGKKQRWTTYRSSPQWLDNHAYCARSGFTHLGLWRKVNVHCITLQPANVS